MARFSHIFIEMALYCSWIPREDTFENPMRINPKRAEKAPQGSRHRKVLSSMKPSDIIRFGRLRNGYWTPTDLEEAIDIQKKRKMFPFPEHIFSLIEPMYDEFVSSNGRDWLSEIEAETITRSAFGLSFFPLAPQKLDPIGEESIRSIVKNGGPAQKITIEPLEDGETYSIPVLTNNIRDQMLYTQDAFRAIIASKTSYPLSLSVQIDIIRPLETVSFHSSPFQIDTRGNIDDAIGWAYKELQLMIFYDIKAINQSILGIGFHGFFIKPVLGLEK